MLETEMSNTRTHLVTFKQCNMIADRCVRSKTFQKGGVSRIVGNTQNNMLALRNGDKEVEYFCRLPD